MRIPVGRAWAVRWYALLVLFCAGMLAGCDSGSATAPPVVAPTARPTRPPPDPAAPLITPLAVAPISAPSAARLAHLTTLTGHTGAVSSVAFSADNRLLASGSQDGMVRLWRAADGQLTTLKLADT
jgi:hypothetical protein